MERFMRRLKPKPQGSPRYIFDPVNNKKISFSKAFDPKTRQDGISGFMRVKNEELFLKPVIESVIDSLDEIIIVFADCEDNTPQIAHEAQKRHPDKIKCFHYPVTVCPALAPEFKKIPPESPNSLVNYYNFALAKTTRKIAVKIDGDDYFIPEILKKYTDQIRNQNIQKYLQFRGINLIQHDGKIFVYGERPTAGGNDRGFFTVIPETYHRLAVSCEGFVHPYSVQDLGYFYYHLKLLKPSWGLDNYCVPKDVRIELISKKQAALKKLYTWNEFLQTHPELAHIPSPEKSGIHPVGSVKKRLSEEE
jgi:glycosyltransferase involved in cell wall biosynthesis